MRTPWHVLWGSGHGVLRALAPQTRLVCAALAVAACLVPRVSSPPGLGAVAAVVLLWLLLCRPPAAVVRGALALGLVMLGPVLLLTPLIHSQSPASGWGTAASAPLTILVRGLACMLVTVAAAATLTPTELRQGLIRLPVPRIATLILLQVVQQTATLLGETRRVATAVTVRGGALGTAAGLRLLSSLPTVWLPRIMGRAERVAIAMELRGAAEVELEALGGVRARGADLLAVAAAVLLVAGAVALRLWGGS